LTVLISNFSYGQGKEKVYSYKSFPELTLPTTINASSITRSLTSAGSGSGWTLSLLPSGGFELIENVDCTESLSFAKGKWQLQGNKLLLRSLKFKRTYDIVLFGNYTFVVEQSEKQRFLKSFDLLRQKFSSEISETKFEYMYLQLQDDYLNRRGKIASS
jgi:hypothetical protein